MLECAAKLLFERSEQSVTTIPRPIDFASWIKQYPGVKVVVITKGNETVAAPAAEEYVTGDAYICC